MAQKAIKTAADSLREGKIKIKNDAIVIIQNIVVAVNLGGSIHLEKATRVLARSMDEPEQFPEIIYRILDPSGFLDFFIRKTWLHWK